MSKFLALILMGTLLLTGCSIGSQNPNQKDGEKQGDVSNMKDGKITTVATVKDKLEDDSIWCATFQLIWNDMKNEVVKQDVVFANQPEIVDNLNKESFTEDMISDEYYYKTYGSATVSLRDEIKKAIKEKFDETSDILDSFSWDDDENISADFRRYFFYTMLKREFEFPKIFTKLDNGKFGKTYNDVKYFGIDKSTESAVYDQVEVLYYNSKDDFAVVLHTKNNDEVVLCKSPVGKTFEEIYANMNEKAQKYDGKKIFTKYDELKVPYISFDEKREYTELENQPFLTVDGENAEIEKALQTIKFELDEKGGKIKSEAGMAMNVTSMAPVDTPERRYFYLDNTFAMFLKEESKDVPYFGAKITNIKNYQ